MDNNEPEVNVRKICVFFAAGDNMGRLRLAVCILCMVALLGSRTWMLMGSDWILRRGISQCKYSFPMNERWHLCRRLYMYRCCVHVIYLHYGLGQDVSILQHFYYNV